MKNSLSVIRKDKELLIFPLISGIIMVLIGLTFIGGLFFTSPNFIHSPLIIVPVLVMYLLFYFIGIYFNTALIGCATIRLEGSDPQLKDGFRIANEHLRAIAGWALIAAIVGIVIFLFALLGIIPIALGYMIGGLLLVIGFAIAIIYWIIIACVGSAAQGVLTAALYRYATTGKVSPDVVPEHLLKTLKH